MANKYFFSFQLEVDDRNWPPFSVERLPFNLNESGCYELLAPPLFIKELSAGDCLQISSDKTGLIESWRAIRKSSRSTVWVLVSDSDKQAYERTFDLLRAAGCNTVKCPNFGLMAVDIPESIEREKLEGLLDCFSEDDVAYPSYRHER